MTGKTERVVTAAVAITLGSATGLVGAVVGAAAVDYAVQKLEQRGKKKS